MPQHPYAVVGGGPAAGAAARALAAAGADVVLLTAEDRPPYDRTVLSTEVLLRADAPVPEVWPATAEWRARIEVRTGTEVVGLDPDARTLTTSAGEPLTYAGVVLAPGAEPRRLTVPGAGGPGVHHLRDVTDARAIHDALGRVRRLVVVGGGVIGLEVAASAATRGVDVEVVEAAQRVLGRGVPAPVAAWLADVHAGHGVRIRTGRHPDAVERAPDGNVTGVRLDDGTLLPADAVVVGIGIVPREHLARRAGLRCDDGIIVDGSGRTSHPAVFAAGDAVRMRRPGDAHGIRLESFSAAGRQGEVAAHAMLGQDDSFTDVPWWWSDQYDTTLQSIGVAPAGAEEQVVDVPDGLLVLSFAAGRMVAACGVTHGPAIARPVRAAGPLIAAGGRLDLDDVVATRGDLGALAGVLRTAGRATA
jgi:3-phenylpropionate/trans-cinnamate dioxygenase ferredoxin reductase subunit